MGCEIPASFPCRDGREIRVLRLRLRLRRSWLAALSPPTHSFPPFQAPEPLGAGWEPLFPPFEL